MSWHLGRMALFDIESTGIDPFRDRIVTAAVIGVGGGQSTSSQSWLLNPGIEIPQGAIDVHGITNEQAATGVDAAAGVLAIAQTVFAASRSGAPIVGHNVVYDLTLLHAECVRHGLSALAAAVAGIAPVVDTQIIEKHLDPFRPKEPKPWTKRPNDLCGSHQLVECCRLWGIDLSAADAHGAEADALAAGRLAWRLATDPDRFARWDDPRRPVTRVHPAGLTLEELHDWQRGVYFQSARSFQAYMRGEARSKPDEVDPEFVARTEWPVQPLPDGWAPDQLPEPREAVPA